MNDLEVTLEQNTDFQTTVYDVNYLPDYVKAEEERRANETIRISNEQNRQANELLRVALYNDLEEKKEQDYWRGNGIVSTTKIGTSGLVDTYTITYDDGETDTFTVTNGQDGQDGDPGQDGQDGQDATINGVNTLTIQEGQNITITQSGSTMTISSTGGSGTSDYDDLSNKPSINNVTLSGNKSLSDLGIQPSGNYVTNTDYAAFNKGGVVKVGDNAITVDSSGNLKGVDLTYAQYTSAGNNFIIDKGTLENVITGKQLINQTTLDTSQATQDTKITNLENQVFGDETIEGEGTSLTLDGTLKGQFNEIDLKGNTSQDGMPTPTSPIPVNVVSGDNSITICGKNLFSGFTKGKGLNITTGAISDNNNGAVSDYIPVDFSIHTNYYLSGLTDTLNSFVASYNSKKEFLGRTQGTFVTDWSLKSTSFPSGTPQGTGDIAYIIVYQYKSSGNTGTINDIDNLSIQLEFGSSATTFEPYMGATYPINLPEGMELCKIGNYQDYFYKDSDKWYLYKAIGKVVLNGSESWNRYGTSSIERYYLENLHWVENIGYCDYAIIGLYANRNNVADNNKIFIGNNSLQFRRDDLVGGTTVTTFKNWLSTHNTTVYYVLTTPTNTEITYQPLIDQLNLLEKAQSKENQTNISQVNNDLPFIISASAFLNNINGKIALLNKLMEV